MTQIKLEKGSTVTDWVPEANESTSITRFWAGESYDKRDVAPFRVLQNGTIIAKRGEFGGTFTGSIEIGNITISDKIGTSDKPGIGAFEIKNDTNTDVRIRIAEDESIFKSDIYYGEKSSNPPIKYEYSTTPSNNKLILNESEMIFNKTLGDEFDGYVTKSIKITGQKIQMAESSSIETNANDEIKIMTTEPKGRLYLGSHYDGEADGTSPGDMDLYVSGNVHTDDIYMGTTNIMCVYDGENAGIDFFIE
ncbi:hypothetical protein [Paraclostridium dentum]|uniref:hypothetical protein n=1 Tax=Paraclostridium dentum TaxID=2662455 RepID=UPI003F37006B